MTAPGASTGNDLAWPSGGASTVRPSRIPAPKWGLIIGVAAAIAVLGGGAVGAIILLTALGRGDPVPPPPSPVVQIVAPEVEEAQPVPPAEETVVTITLAGVPEGAQVFLDGALVEGTTLPLPRSAALREVRVELAGHRPWRRMVAPGDDQTVEVALVVLEDDNEEDDRRDEPRVDRPARPRRTFDTAFPGR